MATQLVFTNIEIPSRIYRTSNWRETKSTQESRSGPHLSQVFPSRSFIPYSMLLQVRPGLTCEMINWSLLKCWSCWHLENISYGEIYLSCFSLEKFFRSSALLLFMLYALFMMSRQGKFNEAINKFTKKLIFFRTWQTGLHWHWWTELHASKDPNSYTQMREITSCNNLSKCVSITGKADSAKSKCSHYFNLSTTSYSFSQYIDALAIKIIYFTYIYFSTYSIN